MSGIYHHLSPGDRAVIMIERQNGSSLGSMARRLGRSPSTLSCELRRAGSEPCDALVRLKVIESVVVPAVAVASLWKASACMGMSATGWC